MTLKVESFSIVGDFELQVKFSNGETHLIDLSHELEGEVFAPLKDKRYFEKAYLTEWRVIEWPNGADFAPEFLYQIGKKIS